MSTVLMLPAAPSGWRDRRPWRVAVDVNGVETQQLALLEVRAGRGSEGSQATLEWTGTSADFGEARRLAGRGERVQARIVRTTFAGRVDDWPLFDGHLVEARVEFSGAGRRVLLDAADGLRFRHGGVIVAGQHATDETGNLAFAGDMPLVLNPAGRPNRSQSTTTINRRSTCVFEHRPGQAAFWSAADAINYLLATHLAGDERIALPSVERLEALCGDVRPREMELTGRGVLAALEKLGETAGVWFTVEPRPSVRRGARWRMRWFARTGSRLVVMRHQRAGESMHPAGTDVQAGSLAFDHDSSRHVWVALGEPERVECTFALVAGWDPNDEGGEHRDYSRANDAFASVRDVYRRWVLNEAGDWSGEPFNRGPAADLGGVFGDSDCLLRRRRLLACLSRDAQGRSFGVHVETSYDDGTSWQLYPGRIDVLRDEAGIWLADDQLPPDHWQAATGDSLAVRVTASLESDRRVRAELEDPVRADGLRTVHHLRWLPGRYRRQWVAPGSQLAGDPAVVSADEADDRDVLAAALAEEVRLNRTAATRGHLALPWLSATYQVGDRIRGISGQNLPFSAGDARHEREPLVRSIRHELGERWQTTLELE